MPRTISMTDGGSGTSCRICTAQMCVVCQEKLDSCRCPSASYGYCGRCCEKRRQTVTGKCSDGTVRSRVYRTETGIELASPPPPLCDPPPPLCDPPPPQCDPPPPPSRRKRSLEEPRKRRCSKKCCDSKKQGIDPMLLLLMHYLYKKSLKKNCNQCGRSAGGDDFVKRLGSRNGYDDYEKPRTRGPCCDCGSRRKSCGCSQKTARIVDDDDDEVRITRRSSGKLPSRSSSFRAPEPPAPSPTPSLMTSQQWLPPPPQQCPGNLQSSVTPMNSVLTSAPPNAGYSGIFCTPGVLDNRGMITACTSVPAACRDPKPEPPQCCCPVIRTCQCEKDEPVIVYREVREPIRTVCETRDTEVQCDSSPRGTRTVSSIPTSEVRSVAECQTDMTLPIKKSVVVMDRASTKLGFFPRDSSGAYYLARSRPTFLLPAETFSNDSGQPAKRVKSSTYTPKRLSRK